MVGIDATLEEIENILLNDQWGSVYAFLVNEGGETIFHPLLRPSTEVRKSPLDPSIPMFKIQILPNVLNAFSVILVGSFGFKSGLCYSDMLSSFSFTIPPLEYQENLLEK